MLPFPGMLKAAAFLAVLVCLLLPALPAAAQSAKAPLPGSIAAHPDWPKAAPADVSSVDAILAALYDVISGPAGQPGAQLEPLPFALRSGCAPHPGAPEQNRQ